jgi:hypothetical protein
VKEFGPFAKQKASNKNKYWHYGVEFGSRKIKGKKTKVDEMLTDSDDE